MSKTTDKKIDNILNIFKEHPNEELNIDFLLANVTVGRTSLYKYLNLLVERGLIEKKDIRNIERNTTNTLYFYKQTGKQTSKKNLAEANTLLSISKDDYYYYQIINYLQQEKRSILDLFEHFIHPDHTTEFVGEYIETNDACYLPISSHKFRDLLHHLITTNIIQIKDGEYYYIDTNLPISLNLNANLAEIGEIEDILLELKNGYEFKGHQFESQIKSIINKLQYLVGDIDDTDEDNDIFLVYGRTFLDTVEIQEQMNKINSYAFDKKTVRITYQTRTGKSYSISFNVGLLVYSYEKNAIYFIGKNLKYPDRDTIIQINKIISMKELDEKNSDFHSKEYLDKLEMMFAPETEPDGYLDVCVHFNNIFSIKNKLTMLVKSRKYASLEEAKEIIDGEERNILIYRDKIIGMESFANYLRKYGRSCHVKAPQKLRERMLFTVERTLNRYQEVSDES